MALIMEVFNSPYYFGEISLMEAKNILTKEPANSYLFRKLKDGSVTMATLIDNSRYLFELEIKNCSCDKFLLPIQRFQCLKEFVEYCNSVVTKFTIVRFNLPVKRRTPFSLEDIANSLVITQFENSLDQLILPKNLKENFSISCHNHFEILFDEKEASKQNSNFANGEYYQECFYFRITDTPNFRYWRPIRLCPIKGQNTYAQTRPDSGVKRMASRTFA